MTGAKILLVDDEVIFTRNLSKLLTIKGHRVKAVNSGDSAIQTLKEESFDVIVLDIKMPGMDGIATLEEIRKLGLSTRTLVLTGHGTIDDALEVIRQGAYDYLTKPCDIDALISKIEEAYNVKKPEVRD